MVICITCLPSMGCQVARSTSGWARISFQRVLGCGSRLSCVDLRYIRKSGGFRTGFEEESRLMARWGIKIPIYALLVFSVRDSLTENAFKEDAPY